MTAQNIKERYGRIKAKWLKYAPGQWWGDSVDVRFYIIDRAMQYTGPDCRVLDIGCNAGIVLSELAGARLRVGLDLSLDYLAKAASLDEPFSLINGRAERLPFRDGSFDLVMANHVLPYVEDAFKAQFIKEGMRVLRKGGIFFLSTWNKNYLRYREDRIATRPADLEALLRSSLSGDISYRIRGYNPLPPFPWFLPNRILGKIPGIWGMLEFLSDRDILKDNCVSFLVEIRKG